MSQLVALHQAIHIADAALRAATMNNAGSVQEALVLMDDARRLALPMFPVLATLIRQAEQAVVGQGKAGLASPEERRGLATAILTSVLRDVHVQDPHPPAERPN